MQFKAASFVNKQRRNESVLATMHHESAPHPHRNINNVWKNSMIAQKHINAL
jgi:hypothetical protein